ncbi:MAG TPA: hypothetical protein VF360_03455 [Candidatus Methanoperedens sp.]
MYKNKEISKRINPAVCRKWVEENFTAKIMADKYEKYIIDSWEFEI